MVKAREFRWITVSDDGSHDRRAAALLGFVVTLLIIVLALLIIRKLQVRCLIEDCILAGGRSCQHVAENLRVSNTFETMADNARNWIIRQIGHQP